MWKEVRFRIRQIDIIRQVVEKKGYLVLLIQQLLWHAAGPAVASLPPTMLRLTDNLRITQQEKLSFSFLRFVFLGRHTHYERHQLY